MKIAKSVRSFFAGVVFLILLACVAAVVVDEKMSKQLNDVDPTAEEMAQAVPFK